MKQYLLLPRISIQDANAMNGSMAAGFPAMTSWLGAEYALERKLKEYGFDVQLPQMAVSCLEAHLQAHKGNDLWSLSAKRKPLGVKGNKTFNVAFIEKARIHLKVSLLLEVEGLELDEKEIEKFLFIVRQQLPTLKIAGGDIISFKQPKLFTVSSLEQERKIILRLMPGFIPIDQTEMLKREEKNGKDALDALLDLLAIHAERNEENEKTYSKQEIGWLVPLAVGFRGLSPLGKVSQQRDLYYQHRFVEPIITLCEFKMAHRFHELADILWHQEYDENKGLYLCCQ